MFATEIRDRLATPATRTEIRNAWRAHFRRLGVPGRQVIWATGPGEPGAGRYEEAGDGSDWHRACREAAGWVHDWAFANLRTHAYSAADLRAREETWVALGMDRGAEAVVRHWFPGGSRTRWGEAPRDAARSATWSEIVGRSENPFSPLMTVWSATAFAYVGVGTVVCLPIPKAAVDSRGRLHHESGPAVEWGDERHFFWHGVRVPSRIVQAPESLGLMDVRQERNAEVRRVMVERMPGERLTGAGTLLHREGDRALWSIPFGPRQDVALVRVVCPSTGRVYHLRVPASVRTCQDAVAWTFGFANADRYAPLVET